MSSHDEVLVVFSTFPSGDQAAEVARTLVEERLAACVNIAPAVRSIYRWDGAIQDDGEALAIIKTTHAQFDAMSARLLALHPYERPEVIGMPVAAGSGAYLAWVASSVG